MVSLFYDGLSPEHRYYVNSFNEDHEPFKDNKEVKHTLSYAITRFLGHKASDRTAAVALTTIIRPGYLEVRPTNSVPIRVGPQANLRSGHAVDIVKTVRYYNKKGCPSPYWHNHTGHKDNYQRESGGGKRKREGKSSRESKRSKEDQKDSSKDEDYRNSTRDTTKASANVAVAGTDVESAHAFAASSIAGGTTPT